MRRYLSLRGYSCQITIEQYADVPLQYRPTAAGNKLVMRLFRYPTVSKGQYAGWSSGIRWPAMYSTVEVAVRDAENFMRSEGSFIGSFWSETVNKEIL